MRLTLALLLMTAATATAADPPKITGESRVKAFQLVKLSATGIDAKTGLVWRVRPQDSQNAGRVQWASPTSAPDVAWVAPPGRYLVELITVGPPDATGRPVVGGDELLVEILPCPDHAPAPKPPAPNPPGPAPSPDPLRAKLKAAYDTDPGESPAKDATRRDLVALYRQAVTLAGDPTVATTAALASRLKAAASTLAAGGLTGTRTAIAAELATAFPADGPLDAASRTRAAALFDRIASALDW